MPNKKKKGELERSSINDFAPQDRRSFRNSLADPRYKGDDYYVDEEIRNIGPLRSRGCSDFIFTIIFIAFVGLMAYLTYGSIQNGNPEALVNGVDADGNICGLNASVADYPRLYYMVQADVKIVQAQNDQSL